jgi:hypothetical protein
MVHLDSVAWLLPGSMLLSAVKVEQDEEAGDAYSLVVRWDSLDQSSGQLQGLQVLQLTEAMVEADATSVYDGPYLHTASVPQLGAVVYANRKVGACWLAEGAVVCTVLQGIISMVLAVAGITYAQAGCSSRRAAPSDASILLVLDAGAHL